MSICWEKTLHLQRAQEAQHQRLSDDEVPEYRQVAHSDPPRYEFLWGPRAHAETSKMKVLEFLAKVNETVPSAFSSQYEEAL